MKELSLNEVEDVSGGNPVVAAIATLALSPAAGIVVGGAVTAVAAYAAYKAVKSLI